MPWSAQTVSRYLSSLFFFFNDTATTEIYTLSLHDALPILITSSGTSAPRSIYRLASRPSLVPAARASRSMSRSEEHTSELQSQSNLVCRLLLEKKNSIRAYLRLADIVDDMCHVHDAALQHD